MSQLERITRLVEAKNKRHAKKLRESFASLDERYHQRAETFFSKYEAFANYNGRSLEYGVESYLKMVEDMIYEYMQFQKTGEYTCKSFEEAYKKVYSNPAVMEYYMHGLMLSQYLWGHHYGILLHFEDAIGRYSRDIRSYLEIGGGHGLYFNEALMRIDTQKCRFDLVDISESSVLMAKQFINDPRANFYCQDIYEYDQHTNYDFITMGEVLEHVEDPVALLKRIRELLVDGGHVYISTPSNSPALDHIFLFRSMQHVEDVIEEAGFVIMDKRHLPSENLSVEEAEKRKVTVMFSGVLRKI